jgi:hypothetical protein
MAKRCKDHGGRTEDYVDCPDCMNDLNEELGIETKQCEQAVAYNSRCYRKPNYVVEGRSLCTQHARMFQKKQWTRYNKWVDLDKIS